MKISLKAKMGLVLAFLIILTVTVLSVLVLKGIETNQRDQLESELIQKSKAAEQTIHQSYVTGDPSLNTDSFLQQKDSALHLQLHHKAECKQSYIIKKDRKQEALFPSAKKMWMFLIRLVML